MLYKTLGKTGLKVSVLGYGASPLGNEFATIDPREGTAAVHAAIDQGINYFDVSPYYGRTLAETRLGEALVGHRHQVLLATKAGRYDKDRPEGFDYSAERITRSIDESLLRLRTDYVDVLQVHDIEFTRLQQIIEETVPAMQRLKATGKVRFVGITGYPLPALRRVVEACPVDTILSYCRYDLLDTTLDQVLVPLARAEGIGLINASPLHMGVLSQRGAPEWHPAPKRVLEAARQAAALCAARGADLADLAMQFALAYPAVSMTLVGMSRPEHVGRNVRLIGTQADPDLLADVQAILAPVMNMAWQEGLPENWEAGALPKMAA